MSFVVGRGECAFIDHVSGQWIEQPRAQALVASRRTATEMDKPIPSCPTPSLHSKGEIHIELTRAHLLCPPPTSKFPLVPVEGSDSSLTLPLPPPPPPLPPACELCNGLRVACAPSLVTAGAAGSAVATIAAGDTDSEGACLWFCCCCCCCCCRLCRILSRYSCTSRSA